MTENPQFQLLCSFTTLAKCDATIDSIVQTYEVIGEKIYVLQNVESQTDVFLTYNISNEQSHVRFLNTISVHRKKDFNVIYSINALNALITRKTGRANSDAQIDWSQYKNSLVIADGSVVHVLPTKLLRIARLN